MKPVTPEAKVEHHIQQHADIRTIVQYAPDVASLLLIAARWQDASQRWYAYEALKTLAKQYVGDDAENPLLQTERYYEACIQALDALLLPPVEEET